MAESAGTLQTIATHLALAFKPLSEAVSNPRHFRRLLFQLGWKAVDLPPAWSALGTAVEDAVAKAEALTADPTPEEIGALLESVSNAYDAVRSINAAPTGVDAAAFLAEIGERLFELLLTQYLAAELPTVYDVLLALHVIQLEHSPATAERPSFLRVKFEWAEIPKVITEPDKLPERVYGWGTPHFDAALVLEHMTELFHALRFPVRLKLPERELVEGYTGRRSVSRPRTAKSLTVPFYYIEVAGEQVEAAFALRELPASAEKLSGLVLEPQIPEQFPLTLTLADTITLRVVAGTNVASQAGILIRPGEIDVKYPFAPGTTPPSAGIGVGFDFKPTEPTILLGSPAATRLEFQGASVDLAARSVNGVFEAVFGAQLTAMALVLVAGEGDSFLKWVLRDGQTRIDTPLGFEWSSRFGVRFKGSASFEVAVHPHLSIGPVSINEVTVRLAVPPKSPPDVTVELGAGISGQIGPIAFLLQGVGLKTGLTFSDGNLGPLDVRLGFKPPNGVGLAIGGGGFKGGGFLVYDSDKGEYAGGLEIEFQDRISIKAIGILDTKLPDGSPGYSLLILITAEFVPIQLGFGFTLNGVGGLLGVNHTVATDVLRAGIHDGTLDSILFPKDIVANAPKIISDVKRVFPPLPNHVLVGPMGKLGWGTPTLVSLELGIILEIPRPGFIIVGILRATLPVEDAPILELRVNFLGIVDFEKGQLSFDASLYDSHVLSCPLTGDMAVRFFWGENANLLATVGGFHPAYTPPPMGLPPLQRITLDLFPSKPKVRAEGYFAITSNTIQFGAKLEVSAGASVFNIYGFMALDVLVQRVPFHFVAEFSAKLAVRSGSHTLFSVKIDATLEGPTPWHIHGTGSFEIGFVFTVTIHVHFDITIGPELTSLLPVLQVLPLLVEAFANAGNWRAILPSGSSLSVTLRELAAEGDRLVVHPFGTLEISQKVAPLNLPLDRVGAQRVDNGKTFGVRAVQIGTAGGGAPPDPAKEQFAPAQFLDMSDAEKLSRKSFEKYDSGVRLGGGERPAADRSMELDVAYEVIYVPQKRKPARFKLPQRLFDAFARGSSIAQSPLSFEKRSPSGLGTARIALVEEKFAVAATKDLTLHSGDLVFDSEAEAHAALQRAVDRDPALTRELQVVPLFEVNAA
jgi:hypothetical protein